VQGLRIRQRLKVQYGGVLSAEVPVSVSQMIAPLFCGYTSFQDPSGMDECHVVQPYHLPRQRLTNITFQHDGQEEDRPELPSREGSLEKEDEMKIHPDSLQINQDAPELVENASNTTRGKTRGAPRRAPGRRRRVTSSSSENDEEPSTRRTTRRVLIPPVRNLRARKSKA
jgi:hypothetical protein